MPPILSLHNVSFTYAFGKNPALRGVSLDVPAGQICGVVGRAGAGKSTLCLLSAGFIPQFYRGQVDGAAQVDGRNLLQLAVAELVSSVGLVGSNPFSQISGARFTVFEEVAFGLENIGLPREDIIARTEWALGALQLADLRDRSPYALSGGQQQRLVLAATLALRPPVLVLDEPTAQLDPLATEGLAALLRDLSRHGTTILFAEHRLEWAAALADRVVVLDQGRIVADGRPGDVFTDALLLDRGIGWPRPATIAARYRAAGAWPADRPLPVTVDALTAGLQATATGHRVSAAEHGQLPRLPPQEAPIVTLRDVRFTYPGGVEALRGVSLRIGPGERVALLGRNGAGKSTLVRHLNGLLHPTSGQVITAGIDTRTTTVAQCARQVGIVFQDVRNQLFARTVRDELCFGPRNLGFDATQVEQSVTAALEALGLGEVAGEHPYDLPQALRRLVAIAAVLAMNTPLLVLDEPTAGLDSAAIALLAALTRDLAAQGKSVLVVSHDLDFCYEALDRVILMCEGIVVLDNAWATLDASALSELETTVGLPIELRVANVLNPASP
jgi:energy-coupling factor transport system ATP-binding protein